MLEIVKFREMLEQRIANRAPPLLAIPDENKPLIAKLVHERYLISYTQKKPYSVRVLSDKSLSALVKHVHRQLLPSQDEDGDPSSLSASSSLSLHVVEAAIKAVAARNNYGLDAVAGGGKAPAAMCIWRWEVKEQHQDYLPKNVREKAEMRLVERAQVSHFMCLVSL
jgi:hypothetical protein